MRKATKHSYLTKARDDFGAAFLITLCGRHLPDDSESALWIEEFVARWVEERRSDLCLNCATEMQLGGANQCREVQA